MIIHGDMLPFSTEREIENQTVAPPEFAETGSATDCHLLACGGIEYIEDACAGCDFIHEHFITGLHRRHHRTGRDREGSEQQRMPDHKTDKTETEQKQHVLSPTRPINVQYDTPNVQC